MTFAKTKIQGVWVHTPKLFWDNRGSFHEAFKVSEIKNELGLDFPVLQVNQSESHKGVIRGIHFTSEEAGQAKFVSCVQGAIWDIVVDLRPKSETFGEWESTLISSSNKKSVLIAEGIGHGFLALEDATIINYLCTKEYDPMIEQAVNIFDEKLAINFSDVATDWNVNKFILSTKDEGAPKLS